MQPDDREQFILDNQWAFKYGAQQEFGMRDERCEEGEEVISRKTIEDSIDGDNAEAYRIVLDGKKVGGDDEIIDRTGICEKWGILDPVQIIDMLAICGDSADNVPGVKGVGEVGAGKLVSKYGSIENIYAHLSELTPRLQAQFEEARSYIGLSKELVTIKTDIPLETTAEDMQMATEFKPEIADLFEKYEFNSLKRFIAHVGR